MVRTVLAPNASPLTLDGTRTYLIGHGRVVIIDPGSREPTHQDAVADLVGRGTVAAVLVTHDHPDHMAGADDLARRFDAPLHAGSRRNLHDGDRFDSDAGEVVAVATPGHTPDHFAFHWPAGGALFCGDLMMGGHDTALLAPPEGRLGPYLASLERVRGLGADVIHPAHGPPFHDPDAALDRYVDHRLRRLDQVLGALRRGALETDDLLADVYGQDLDPALRDAARAALRAYLDHLQGAGRARRLGRRWEAVPG